MFLYLQTVRSSVYQPFITHTLCLNPIYISFICGYMWFLWWLLQPGSVWWPGVQGSCPWPRFSHLHVEFTRRWTAEWVFLRGNRLSLCVTKEFLCDLSVSLSRWSLLIRQEQIPQCDQPFHFPSEQTHTGGLTDPVLCSVCLLDVCFHGNCSNNRQQWWDWAVDDSHLVSPGYRSSFHTNVYFCFWIFFIQHLFIFWFILHIVTSFHYRSRVFSAYFWC